MKIISVNVSKAREVEYEGKIVRSGIWKQPVQGPIKVEEINLAGDRQETPIIHGGIHKAVYAFSYDQYAWWANELQREDLDCGMFGENLTVAGLDETNARIGDVWQAGSVQFAVTGPRAPCSKLAMKFDDKSIPRRFTEAGRSGVYLRVLQTGSLQAGNEIVQLTVSDGVTVHDLFRAYTQPRKDGSAGILQAAVDNPYIDPEMVKNIMKRLKALKANKP